MSYTKKLLVSSALAFASFSQVAVGSETLTVTLQETSPQMVQRQEKPHLAPLTKALPAAPLSVWGVCSSFVMSFFEPFIQDAPVALEAIKKQKKELDQQGIYEYASNATASAGKFVIENPFDAVIAAGSVAFGLNMADAFFVPLAMQTASGLKNSQVLWELAQSADHDKMKSALYILAVAYAATNLVTTVDAALTPTFGTLFQINQNSLNGGNSPSTASLPNGKLVTVWSGNGNPAHVFGRTYFSNGTGFSNEFQVTSTPAGIGIPVVSATAGGFGVVWLNNTLSVAARMYDSNTNPLTSPFPVQQSTTGYTDFSNPTIGSLNGTALIAWGGAGSVGNADTLMRTFSSNGTPLTGQSAINIGGSGTPSVIGLSDGRALVTWYGFNPNSLFGNFVSADGTPSGSAFSINQTAITFDHTTKGAGLTDGSAFVPYETAAGNIARIVQSQSSIGAEFSIGNDRGDGAAAAGLTDGTALAVWGSANVNGHIAGKLFNSAGTALTSEFSVPSSNPDFFPLASGLPTGGAFISWQDATTHKLMGVTVSFNVPPTPTVMPTSVPTSHPTSAPAPTVIPTSHPTSAPAPASAATGLTPSLLTIPVVIGGYLANWWRG